MILVLGAGISGISAAYHLKKKGIAAIIYEKNNNWGGLCGNFEIKGFRFDHAIHLSFTNDGYVKQVFSESTEYLAHKPNASNYYKGVWLKHPAQNNLFPLAPEFKVKIITDFINNKDQEKLDSYKNYEDWLRSQYGGFFAVNFPMKYTKKYWCCEASELSTAWVGDRMYKPNIEEVLLGAFSSDTPNTYYANEMRYPIEGGYKSFLKKMATECCFKLNHEVVLINTENKRVTFSNGKEEEYSELISSIPLPEYKNLIPDIPLQVREACNNLYSTNVAIVSIGLKKKQNKSNESKNLWFYLYDEDILASRCYRPNMKSQDNVPEGCESYQFEIYHTKRKPLSLNNIDLIEHIISKSVELGFFAREDIVVKDYRNIEYGNVVFYQGMEDDRKIVLDYLHKNHIYTIGRFGEWDYLWSDQSFLSGMNAAKKIIKSSKN